MSIGVFCVKLKQQRYTTKQTKYPCKVIYENLTVVYVCFSTFENMYEDMEKIRCKFVRQIL